MSNSKSEKQAIAIVWFKRDLRLTDHEPLALAEAQGLPILLVYCFEPSVMHNDDSDVRHWRFVYQSLQDMQSKGAKILHAECICTCRLRERRSLANTQLLSPSCRESPRASPRLCSSHKPGPSDPHCR
jgi:hypothetical protein